MRRSNKKSEEAYLRGHKKYSDSHIPTYTYAEVKKICENNLNNFNAAEGKWYNSLLCRVKI